MPKVGHVVEVGELGVDVVGPGRESEADEERQAEDAPHLVAAPGEDPEHEEEHADGADDEDRPDADQRYAGEDLLHRAAPSRRGRTGRDVDEAGPPRPDATNVPSRYRSA